MVMSRESNMRQYLIALAILVPVGGYLLHSLLAKEEKAIRAGRAEVSVAAPDFPLDANPIDRSNSERVGSYSDVLADVNPAVVGVYPSRIVRVIDGRRLNPLEEMLRRYYGLPLPEGGNSEGEERKLPQGLGSGVIVSADGYILTNNHVITDERGNKADEILVQLSDQREFVAEIVGSDERTDVAVLKVDAEDLPHLPMADSDNLRVGDIVFAVGNPLGVGLTVTMGIVSATGRTNLGLLGQEGFENFIQTDASINPGNSGGPLVDADGRLVGINTVIISRSGGNIGIGFAIPVTLARNVMLSLIQTGTVPRGLLGVNIQDLDRDIAEAMELEDTRGALIQNVIEGLPAHTAGLRRGDVILAVGDKEIAGVSDLQFFIGSSPPGTAVTLTVMREGRKQEFEVTLSDKDDPTQIAGGSSDSILEGITLEKLNSRTREEFGIDVDVEGIAVTAVEARSPHVRSLREGMVIVEVNKSPVRSLSDVQNLLKRGANYLWVHDRGGTYGYVAIRLR